MQKLPPYLQSLIETTNPSGSLDEWMYLVERNVDKMPKRPIKTQAKPEGNAKPIKTNKGHCFKCGSTQHIAPKCDGSDAAKAEHTANCKPCVQRRKDRAAAKAGQEAKPT